MVEIYGVKYVSLHVRETNYAAYHLYKETLQFAEHGLEPKYYADGENAFDMRRQISRELFGLAPRPGSAPAAPAALAAMAAAGAQPAAASGEKRGRTGEAAPLPTVPLLAGAPDEESTGEALEKAGEAGDVEPGAAVVDEAMKEGGGAGGGKSAAKKKGKRK